MYGSSQGVDRVCGCVSGNGGRAPVGRCVGHRCPAPRDQDLFSGLHLGNVLGQVLQGRLAATQVGRLRRAGVPLLILSTETNPVVAARAAKLGVPCVHGVEDKVTAMEKWVADVGVPLDRVAYLGNDVNDLACMARVGWPVAVPGAHPRVLALAKTVLHRPGGDGAVRELSERVLAARTQGDERGSERG